MPKVLDVKRGTLEGGDSLKPGTAQIIIHFSLTFIVLGDTLADNDEDILATVGIPALYSPLGGATCFVRHAEETETVIHPTTGVPCGLWEVFCEFDNQRSETPDPTDPLAKRPQIHWTGEMGEEVVERDTETGGPIQTKAEERIHLVEEVVYPILEITRYENAPFDPDVILNYVNHINSSPFWGAPEGCALMLPIDSTEEIIEDVLYCRNTYRIKFKIKKNAQGGMTQDSYRRSVLHEGYQYRTQELAGITLTNIIKTHVDAQGNPTKVNLDAEGGLLSPFTGAQPVFLEFSTKYKKDFNNLSLGPY